jgi:putative transposase
MAYNPDIHNRQSIRLKGYDYSTPGFYYITLCTQDRENRFGEIVDGKMVLNGAGELVEAEWKKIPERYGQVILDAYQIMPNHLHGILQITSQNSVGMGLVPIPTALYDVIGTFKSLTQNHYAFHMRNNGWPPFRKRLRQLRFHDHIIRNHDELDSIRRYIIDNPINWLKDQNNPENMMKSNDLNGESLSVLKRDHS